MYNTTEFLEKSYWTVIRKLKESVIIVQMLVNALMLLFNFYSIETNKIIVSIDCGLTII